MDLYLHRPMYLVQRGKFTSGVSSSPATVSATTIAVDINDVTTLAMILPTASRTALIIMLHLTGKCHGSS